MPVSEIAGVKGSLSYAFWLCDKPSNPNETPPTPDCLRQALAAFPPSWARAGYERLLKKE